MNQTDSELITLISRGNEKAFNVLYKRYKDLIYNYLTYVESGVETVEDVFQEVWIKVIKKLREGQDLTNFRRWIFRIASNSYKDYLRKKKIRNILFWEKEDLNTKSSGKNIGITSDFTFHLEKAMVHLSPNQRQIFYLKEIMGMQYDEITKVLGITVTAAKSRMFNAVRKLRKELKEFREN